MTGDEFPPQLLDPHETLVVELTPAGRGAVAVVLAAGPDATRAVDQCFMAVRGRPLADAPNGRILLGRWGGPDGEELVVCRRDERHVEIHCHGGMAAVASVISQLERQGCRRILWQEWLRRTSADPIRTAAQIALSQAPTARTATILLDQYHGALATAIRAASEAISAGEWQRAGEVINAVLAHRDVGAHLTTPWQVVLAGPPNVGKSSLMNSLAGYERAIVSPLHGTTRDVVTTLTAIDGWPVRLSDTAGLRTPQDAIESAGVALATEAIARADMVLLVHDATCSTAIDEPASETTAAANEGTLSCLPERTHLIHVWNKIDLVANPWRSVLASEIRAGSPSERHGEKVVFTSAITGAGIAQLVNAISQAIVSVAPAAGDAVPFSTEQVAALAAASTAIASRNARAACRVLNSLLKKGTGSRNT
ncbi:MAG: 50S ribosome-binding GTPase [Planctomycetes bacterium]|nr:50S ribosome-binding GTPase [Planctomycetota bacterium]